MGYRTQFFGEMTIRMEEDVLLKLNHRLKELDVLNLFEINKTKFKTLDYWKNDGLFEQVLLFIEQNGKISKGSFRLEGDGFFDKSEIKLVNKKLFVFKYDFNLVKRTSIPFDKALSKLRYYTVRGYEIINTPNNSPLYSEVEEIILAHMSGEDSFTKKKHKLFSLIEEHNLIVQLKTPSFMIEFDYDKEINSYFSPFERDENGMKLSDMPFHYNYEL